MIQEFLQKTFLNNRVLDYLISLSVFILGFIVIIIFKNIILKRIKVLAKKSSNSIMINDSLIQNIEKKLTPLLYLVVIYLSLKFLTLNPLLDKSINVLGLILFTIIIVNFLLTTIIGGFEIYLSNKETSKSRKQALSGLFTIVKVIVWLIAIFIILDNLGIKVTTLVASLGIGGVAIALASQAILGDLFSYFAIFFDRPFEIDDFIVIGDYLGTVENIGIKTTRIRSLSGEQLVISNTDLTNSRIRNYKRMDKRRVVFKLGVTYETDLQQLKEIPVKIRNIISGINDTVFDRAHFFSYGDFSLIYEVVYYVIDSDYNKYMDIQQEINFKIKEEFEKCGIQFAYPTQTLFINKT
ncbi:MAG: mechanosensitive ion channel family protein [bacterium]|nr:mechanosensitive ion channel family protein [bacterium]